MAQHEQTFQAGIAQDIDAHLQPAGTYREATNGRLLNNTDSGEVSMGHGLAYCNPPGNVWALSLPAGYAEIGAKDTTLGTLLFSTNGTFSEIGLWRWDEDTVSGNYETVYNDSYEPNLKNKPFDVASATSTDRDRLGWTVDDEFDIKVVAESLSTERVYWTNRRGTMHTFDLIDAWDVFGGSYHTKALAGTPYPKHWRIHAFRERCDLVFPRIKLAGRGKGRLLSGCYQVSMVYQHKNGHESVFSTLTRRVFVTTAAIDDEKTDRQAALRSNHHNRYMQPSGVMSGESLIFKLEGVDIRWESLRVAVVYFTSPEQPAKRVLLKPIVINTSSEITVEIKELQGDELTDGQLNQRYDNVLKVGTLEISENMLVSGDLTFLDPIKFDGSAIRFTPKLRRMEADATEEPTFLSVKNLVSGRMDNDPLTNSNILPDQTIEFSAFSNLLDIHQVNNDFTNYKGQLYDQLLRGYFRGETAEFGVALLDRSGQVLFVEPLPTFTFPEQYGPGPSGEKDFYSLTKRNPVTGRFDLQIMGVVISGLALPVEKLYDQHGDLNVSGFMIVRRKRIARLKHQGLVTPVIKTGNCWNKDNKDYQLAPLPTPDNAFTDNAVAEDSFQNFFQTECRRDKEASGYGTTLSQPYYLVYHSPDVLIEEGLADPAPGDVLKHVGVVSSGYQKDEIDLVGTNTHRYTKSCNTGTQFTRLSTLTTLSRPQLGETTRISFAKVHNGGFAEVYKEIDKDFLKLVFNAEVHPNYNQIVNGKLAATRKDGLLQRYAVIIKTRDWKAVDVAEVQQNNVAGKHNAYRLVNYLQEAPSSGPNEPYFSTGHYQPLTIELLAQAGKRTDSTGKLTHLLFDNVEVWGGDCYANLFDFTRIYPYWSEGCDKSTEINTYPDYAVSHIVPIESKYNLALRWGRSFAANATKPQSTSCDNHNPQFANGISAQQPEDWKYNNVLSLEEAVQFYNVKDPELEIVTDRPYGFQWTPEKNSGQRIDAWRLRYVGNYGAADASLGKITKLISGDTFANLYVWQQFGVGAAPLNASRYQSDDAGDIVINSGKTFNGMVSLSKKFGTQHPASVWVSNGQMGAWDARSGVLLRHSQAGLDELSRLDKLDDTIKAMTADLGASSLNVLSQWNAYAGVDANGDVFISFWHKNVGQRTVIYSPDLSAFTASNMPVHAKRYGRRGRYLFSVDPASPGQLYLHHKGKRGEWFGRVYPTTIKFIVNVASTTTKRFDNGSLNINKAAAGSIVSIRQYTPNGGRAQEHTILGTDERLRWINNRLSYPMHEWDWDGNKEPLRDHYAVVEITIDNSKNIPFELVSFSTSFLPV